MSAHDFQDLLQSATKEAEEFLRVTQLAGDEAFDSMLEQALEAFTRKIGDLLRADRASIFLLDEDKGELWSKGARDASGALVEIRIPRDSGVAGAVLSSGEGVRIADAHSDPRFNDTADRETGYRTRSILCIPLRNREGRVFGVAQILNRLDGQPFEAADQEQFHQFMLSVAVVLESWWQMSERHRTPPAAEPDRDAGPG